MSDAPVHVWLPDQAASSLAGTFTLDQGIAWARCRHEYHVLIRTHRVRLIMVKCMWRDKENGQNRAFPRRRRL